MNNDFYSFTGWLIFIYGNSYDPWLSVLLELFQGSLSDFSLGTVREFSIFAPGRCLIRIKTWLKKERVASREPSAVVEHHLSWCCKVILILIEGRCVSVIGVGNLIVCLICRKEVIYSLSDRDISWSGWDKVFFFELIFHRGFLKGPRDFSRRNERFKLTLAKLVIGLALRTDSRIPFHFHGSALIERGVEALLSQRWLKTIDLFFDLEHRSVHFIV